MRGRTGLVARATALSAAIVVPVFAALTIGGASAAASTTATISAVGSLRTHTNQPSQHQEAIAASPSAAGDVLALAIETKFPGSPSFVTAGVSGGGVSKWSKARAELTLDGFHGQELWWGVVSAPGSSTVTATFTAGATSGTSASATSLDLQELRASSGSSTTWSLDRTGVVDTGAASSTPNYPTLTPTGVNEGYFGYLAVPGWVNAGSTPAVVYQADARGNQCAYDVSVSSALTARASGPSQSFFSIGMLLKTAGAAPPPPPPPPPPPAGSATITAVGSLLTHTNQPSRQQETISASPSAAGDVLALAIETKFPGVPSFVTAGVSGGGVSTWKRAASELTLDGFHGQELWWGVVTTPGASSVTATFTAGSTSGASESATSLDLQEFRSSSGASTAWTLDATGTVDNGSTSTAPAYPTLAPAASNEGYFGYLAVPDWMSPGSTPAVTYQTDARGNQCAYDTAVSSALTATASGPSQTWFSIGMLLRAV